MSAAPTSLTTQDLLQMDIFRGESPDAIEWVLDDCSLRTYPAGSVILEPGHSNDWLYLICTGQARVQLSLTSDNIIAHLGPGECIGEMSILEHSHTSAYAIAETDCELILLNGTALWHLIDTSHTVARNLLHILSARVRRDNQVIDYSLEQQRQFERDSRVDALTGLNNRRWLDEVLPRLIERTSLDDHSLYLMMLDIDHFKQFNDRFGHPGGDCALRNVARIIREHIRPSDMAARYGGEEFTIIQQTISGEEAYAMAERLRQTIAGATIACTADHPLSNLSVSIGIAAWQPGQDMQALLATADAALYKAKKLGRNRVAVA